ncbi:MAG: type II toxin-antitoxin system VapC family toxin [Bifidobacteriaceae bacterium]|jgi:predicted nucleic acid-binding protein|nr:type II toxin-antitoxin system VapC family toxin [Bifidobacteriaceae bacterium]
MIVLDTNVVSEAMRPAPNPAVMAWFKAQAPDTLYLSSVTLAELLFGLASLAEGRREQRPGQLLDKLLGLFAGRVLAFDQEAARRYAQMAVAARQAGSPLPMADGYIAATAAANGGAVATRNSRHFADSGVPVIDPWSGPA